ncbi:hypothetical protein MTR67_051081 [Solanum verrucosum]|uniref:protein-serine/threonine phosphatase n=1 Tax=Solanum verrucosum TaxID=315347 RepID=A0AAF0V6J3_SOLVR|nr:hypothetical protein MTR67_051081 [Solanum verrucosum]
MGIYLSSPKTEKVSEDGENDRLRYGLSSMQGWRATMEDAHAVYPSLDTSASFFGVYDGHGGDEVSKFCAKFLHQEVLNHEAYSAGDIHTSIRHAFLRMDEMMCGQTGQRELAALMAEKDQAKDMIEGLISPPKYGESKGQTDGGSSEEGITGHDVEDLVARLFFSLSASNICESPVSSHDYRGLAMDVVEYSGGGSRWIF